MMTEPHPVVVLSCGHVEARLGAGWCWTSDCENFQNVDSDIRL